MAVAQGINKQTVFAKQSVLGTAVTTGGKVKRRTSSVFSLARDTYTNAEIISHQQSTGATAGVKRTSGKLDGLLSGGTYADQFASLLRRLFTTVTTLTGMSITIAGSGPTYTITRAAGDFLTGGIKIGHVVRLTAGSFNAANLSKNLLVSGVTATVLTVRPLNGVAMVAEGPIASASLAVPGKTTIVPTTGHVNEYWTVEEWYADLSKSEVFTDVKIASADITLPATGNATVSFDCPGLGRTLGTSQSITSPTAETTSNVLTAVSGLVVVNGTTTAITGAQVTITGNIAPGEPEVGSNSISDHVRGRVEVTGQIMAKFSATTLQALYDAQTIVTLILAVADSTDAAAEFITVVLPAIKLFSDTPDDGETKEIIRSYTFTAQINGSGGTALASDQTIAGMQDSLA